MTQTAKWLDKIEVPNARVLRFAFAVFIAGSLFALAIMVLVYG